jgi:hypothetical protein
MGISGTNVIEGFKMFKKSVNGNRFYEDVNVFKSNGNKFRLMGDNASWHTSHAVYNRLQTDGLFFIKNVPYSPELNCIEKLFREIKGHFKRIRLENLQADVNTSVEKMIEA